MSTDTETLATPPHLASEFYAWLWWTSEQREGHFDLGGEIGRFDLWIDDRLAFRNANDNKVTAVMTGENPAATLESRAALAGGKVLNDLRVAIKRDDREFSVTLRGPALDLQRIKLPAGSDMGGGEEALYDRMFLYEELNFLLGGLFKEFAELRSGHRWSDEVLPALQAWVRGMEA